MKELIKEIQADKIVWYGSICAGTFLILTGIYIALIYTVLPPFIPIFNQLPWGVERLSAKIGILLPYIYILLIFITNIILSKMLYEAMPLISRILTITTIIITITTSLFIVRITQLLI